MTVISPNAPKYLSIGACSWAPPAWDKDFYPEDLPGDWRPDYYANEFTCVLLPPDDWAGEESAESLIEWLDEADARFDVFLSVPDQAALTALTEQLPAFEACEHKIRGVLLAEGLHLPNDNLAVFHDVDQGRLSIARNQDAALACLVWRELPNQRALAADIQTLISECEGLQDVWLFVDGPGVQAGHIRDAATIASLFGL